QRPPRGQPRGAVLVFLSAILFVLAARTQINTYMKYFTPPFIVLLVLSARASRARAERPGTVLPPWAAALFIAMMLGGFGALTVAAHSSELRHIIEGLFRPTTYTDGGDINARPQLGREFNPHLSLKRVMRVEGAPVERHLRGMAFETYAVGGWASAMEMR